MTLTNDQLKQLRKEIRLNSIYTDDYTNSFNIPARQVQDFFDGYLEYCETIPNENGDLLCDLINTLTNNEYYNTLFEIANNHNNLCEYYNYYLVEDPLSQEFFKKYY